MKPSPHCLTFWQTIHWTYWVIKQKKRSKVWKHLFEALRRDVCGSFLSPNVLCQPGYHLVHTRPLWGIPYKPHDAEITATAFAFAVCFAVSKMSRDKLERKRARFFGLPSKAGRARIGTSGAPFFVGTPWKKHHRNAEKPCDPCSSCEKNDPIDTDVKSGSVARLQSGSMRNNLF